MLVHTGGVGVVSLVSVPRAGEQALWVWQSHRQRVDTGTRGQLVHITGFGVASLVSVPQAGEQALWV